MPQPCALPALQNLAWSAGERIRDLGVDLVAAGETETATHADVRRIAADLAQRAADLADAAGSPLPVLDAALLERQRDFSLRTFGPGARTAGVLAHIHKELVEVERDPADASEWADVMILAVDGAMRAGHAPADVLAAYRAKLERNFARTWPDWRTMPADAPIEHVRAPGVTWSDARPSKEAVVGRAPVLAPALAARVDVYLEAGFADRAARVAPETCVQPLSVTFEDGEVQS